MAAIWERWARAAGAVFVVLVVAAFIVAGESPQVSDSSEDVVDYLGSNRNQILVAAFLFALGSIFFLWFAAAVANHRRESGEGRVPATVLATGSAFAAIQFVVAALTATLAYSVAGAGDMAVTKAFFDLSLALNTLGGLPAGVFILAAAVGLRRTGSIPSWLAWAGIVIAAIHLLRATAGWASDDFWSPSGGYIFIVIASGLAWILVASFVLFRKASTEETISDHAAPTSA